MSRPGGPALVQAVIEHEIGHVLGLGHVKDPSQLMYDRARPGVTTYAAGDLTGLARLGQGKCFPNH
nr:matrixin family metalloprotease [Arthrobacter sp. SDTb3-6]